MIERYLGREQAEDIFYASMLTGLMSEKQASDLVSCMEKEAKGGAKDGFDWLGLAKSILGGAWKGVGTVAEGGMKVVGEMPKTIGMTALLGGGAGVLGANLYDVIKEQVTHEDPEEKFNSEIEAMYAGKKKELEDAKWMDRIRSMRDELRRGYKKMPTKEYAKRYKALLAALDERSV